MSKFVAITIELVGIAVLGTGIGVEIVTHAHFGYVVITSGACLVAIGGVIWGKFTRQKR